jgi:carbohydrate diacid regulator
MADPQLTPALAQEIAGETSAVIGLNVLITDVEGVVIGSGDVSRVGNVHEASLEVLRTLEPAAHSAEQARALRGVRPGITLPIVIDGTAFGTVGLTGAPRRVRQFGLVVRRQTEILLREAIGLESRLLGERARHDLVRDLAFFDADVVEPAAIAARAGELGLDLSLSRVAVIVEVRGTPAASPLRAIREVFPQDLAAEMTASRFAVLHHPRRANEPARRCARLVAVLHERYGLAAHAGFGTPATDVPGLHASCVDAAAAVRLGPRRRPGESVFAIESLRTEQLLEATAHQARDRFAAGQLGALRGDPAWEALSETLLAWVEHGLNLVHTAAALHIHRNTLLHRLAKIGDLTGRPVRDATAAVPLYLACLAARLDSEVP